MRSLAAPPCSRCGSKNTYAEAIEVPTALDRPFDPVPLIPGTIHCRDCESVPRLCPACGGYMPYGEMHRGTTACWADEARKANLL